MKGPITVNLGSVDKIALGMGKCFIVEGEEIAVFRSRDGGIRAVQNICPHRRGRLSDGMVGDGLVVCPSHGHKFNLASGLGSEPNECVKSFSVRELNGDILLDYCQQPS